MADTGAKLVTSGADGGGVGKIWSNPGNIVSDNASSASYYSYDEAVSNGMNDLIGKGCDFSSIPAGSTIDGVLVSFEGVQLENTDFGGGGTVVYLNTSGGARSATSIALTVDGGGLYHAGSSTSKFGETIDLAYVQDADFGARLKIGAFDTTTEREVTFSVDWMKLTAYYTEPSGNTGSFFRMFA